MGPISTLSKEQVILASIQAACIESLRKKWELTHIKTTDRHVFDVILIWEHMIPWENQLEGYNLFNTIHANHFKDGKTDQKISCIPPHKNAIAQHLASFAMHHMTAFVDIPGNIGDLQYYLDRDSGMVLPSPIREMIPNLGRARLLMVPFRKNQWSASVTF